MDGLRAFAVAAVVAQHFSYPIIGFYGVSVFFVLSGYLITSLLLHEREQTGTISFRGFYRRRFARLSPALVLAVLAALAWALAVGEPIRQWFAGLLGSLTYSTDIIELTPWQQHVSVDFEWSWSLAVEEQFYLLWPSLVLVAFGAWGWAAHSGKHGRFLRARPNPMRGRARLTAACLFFVGLAWLLREQMVWSHASAGRVHFSPESHVDALALGALVAIHSSGRSLGKAGRRLSGLVAALAAAFIVIVARKDGPLSAIALHYAAVGYGVVAFAAALVVLGLVLARGGLFARALSWRPIVYIGKLSYGIYLWNMLVKHVYRHVTGWNTGENRWAELVAFAVLIGVCDLSFRFVETPLRKRWAHKRVPQESPPAFTELQPEVANV